MFSRSIFALGVVLTLSSSEPLASSDEWVESSTPELIAGIIDATEPPRACKDGVCVNGAVFAEVTTSVNDWVSVHNKYRCMHGAPALTWSSDMAVAAQEWADAGVFEHSDSYGRAPPLGPAGENLAAGYSTAEGAIDGWYNEVNDCNWSNGCSSSTNGNAVGHFTALIWKGAKTFGCGVNPTGWNNRAPLYVCNYKGGDTLSGDTPNLTGAYVQNVLQASATASQCADGSSSSGSSGSAPTPPTPPPPTPPTPPPPAPSSSSCNGDGWPGCSGWSGLCGQGYTMSGSSQSLDDFCCETCS